MSGFPGRPATRTPDSAMVETAGARFWPKVDVSGECWIWTAAHNGAGYGVLTMSRAGVKVLAHRWAYEHRFGPIPDGLVIDHLCRTPLCVNPAHLEAVTQRINNLRGNSPSSSQVRRTHCPQGHPYDEENTYRRQGHRSCRTCHREQELRRYRTRKRVNQ